MKHVKMFGKSVPILAIVMASMLIIGASAYLAESEDISNTVTAEVTLGLPMQTGVSLGRPSWATTLCLNIDPNDPNYNKMVLSFPEGVDSDGTTLIKDWEESDWTTTADTLVISGIRGGGTLTLYLRSENLADAHITGIEEIIVSNPEGVTSADFTSVLARTDSIYGDLGYGTEHDLIAAGEGVGYEQININNIRFGGPDASEWHAGETDVIKIEATFNEAARGTYTITYKIVPVPS